MTTLIEKRDRLIASLRVLQRCIVAYSGGVDSAVVAKAAQIALGNDAIAMTASSASLAAGELDGAIATAALIGIRHEVINTDEFDNEAYTRNAPDRCYHCKSELYHRLSRRATTLEIRYILNGANTDDLGDYRPGLRAAAEFEVLSPLVTAEFNKQDVRDLASHWELPIWNKPATPCLSSRIAYGEAVTPERVSMVDRAEQFLKERGFQHVRVRYHQGDLARVEINVNELGRLCTGDMRVELTRHFNQLGFKFITLDLEGFRSGSLNQLVSLDTLT